MKTKIYFVPNDNGYFTCNENYSLHQNISKFYLTYKFLVNEWNHSLFTPLDFLQDIIGKINNDTHLYGLIIEYSLNDILNITSINWKYYKKFLNISNLFKNKQNFKIYIVYFKNNLQNILSKLPVNETTKNNILNIFKDEQLIAANFNNRNNVEHGCCIVLNGNIINNTENDKLEFYLDHELNHYFDKFSFNNHELPENISLVDKIIQIAAIAGYSLKTKNELHDFVLHILNNSEFLEMCCDTVNSLKLWVNAENKFNWFEHRCSSNFLKSEEFNKMRVELQNVILFGTIIRIFSNKHWKLLLKHLKKELLFNKNIINTTVRTIKTFLERLKNKVYL